MTRWKFSANVTGEESGTGLATAVSINNQPRLRCNAARFCIFSRNRAGKLWLLTLKHTPPPIFVCKITKQPRNSLPRNRRILLPTVFPLEFVTSEIHRIEQAARFVGFLRERLDRWNFESRERMIRYRDGEISRKVASFRNNGDTLATTGCNLRFLSGHFHTAMVGEIKRLVKDWNWGKMDAECYPTTFPPAFNRASKGAPTFDRNRFIDGSNMKLRLFPLWLEYTANNLKLRSAFG